MTSAPHYGIYHVPPFVLLEYLELLHNRPVESFSCDLPVSVLPFVCTLNPDFFIERDKMKAPKKS